MNAGYHVILEILQSLDHDDRKTFEKFAQRYKKDDLLQRVYKEFLKNGRSPKLLKDLHVIADERKFSSSGGTHLAIRDRRNIFTEKRQRSDD